MDTAEPALAAASRSSQRRAALSALAIATAAVCGAGTVAVVLSSEHYHDRILWAVFSPMLGWSFIGTGLFAWRRRPESRVGPPMVLVGFAWFLRALKASDTSLLYTLGSRWACFTAQPSSTCS